MTQTVSHRRRFLAGLLIAAAIGVGIESWLLLEARKNIGKQEAQRLAVTTALSLAETVQRAGPENASAVIASFARQHPEFRNLRVVRGVRLEASTRTEDTGDRAAPRRLARDEKDVFDLGQRLRAAVQTNRDEGVSRKEEIEATPLTSGTLLLSAPLEENDTVTGYVQMETPAAPSKTKTSWWVPLIVFAVPVLLFYLAGLRIGEQRFFLAGLSTILLVISLMGFGRYSLTALDAQSKVQTGAVAARVQQESRNAGATLESLSVTVDPPLQPERWDADQFRRPRGFLTASGSIDESKVQGSLRQLEGQIRQAVMLLTILAVLLHAIIGFGLVSKLLTILIENRQAYTYTLPAMIGMIVLVFFPFLYGIILSFTGATLYNTDKAITEIWVGLDNYKDILTDFGFVKKSATGLIFNYENFYWTLLFTIIWTVSNVSIGVSVGLLLALMLNTKGLALRPIYRVLLIFPWAMPNYITALIWRGMFHQQFGVINQGIQLFGGQPISWFEGPFTSFITALTTNGWLSFPFMMVVSLGALQSIPGELYEAARVDGATKWQQFRSITLPSLKPALIPAIILSVVWTFNMFNIIFLVTQGEPGGSTEILITQAYKIAFQKYRYGYAAAYSTVIFLILLMYGSIQNRVTRATEAIAG